MEETQDDNETSEKLSNRIIDSALITNNKLNKGQKGLGEGFESSKEWILQVFGHSTTDQHLQDKSTGGEAAKKTNHDQSRNLSNYKE